jgi:3',5'-cyclic AMP phosphodiesterase CpdA
MQDHDTLLFLTDSHCGWIDGGWSQQPMHPELMHSIAAGISAIAARHEADLIVHGGDLTHSGCAQTADGLVNALSAAAPLALCLGNHDLMLADGMDQWQALRGRGVEVADTVIPLRHVDVVLLNVAWMHEGKPAMFWDGGEPEQVLSAEQHQWLDEVLKGGDRPVCLVVHAPLEPVPARLTGLADDIHPPPAVYARALGELLERHPRVKLVLSGHNHVNTATQRGGRWHLSTSSIAEPPFELRLVRFGPGWFDVRTVPTIGSGPGVRFDPAKAWVSGQPADRELCWQWSDGSATPRSPQSP